MFFFCVSVCLSSSEAEYSQKYFFFYQVKAHKSVSNDASRYLLVRTSLHVASSQKAGQLVQ